jgi:hypothetical protein
MAKIMLWVGGNVWTAAFKIYREIGKVEEEGNCG